jgi:uncharacterized phiE125 gp8 family phage protein
MIEILNGPFEIALSLAEVKAYLKILSPAEDRLLEHLIRTAEALVANRHGHYAITQRVKVTAPLIHNHARGLKRSPRLFYHYPFITLPLHPIQSVEKVQVLRFDGKRRTLDPRYWSLSHTKNPHRLTMKVIDGMTAEIELRVGYGDHAGMVPLTLHQQILLKVGKLYEKRDDCFLQSSVFPRRLSL